MLIEFIRLGGLSVLFLLHCAVCGFAFAERLSLWAQAGEPSRNRYFEWFFAISHGMLLNILLLVILGAYGNLNLQWVLGGATFLLAVAVWSLWSRKNRFSFGFPGLTGLERIVVSALLVMTILAAMHAPGYWDDTMYHLPLARAYLQHQAIVVHEYIRFPLFPQNVNLLITLGLMLGGELVAQVFATLPLFVMALGLLGVSRWQTGSVNAGVLAALSLFVLRPIGDTLGYAYIDNGLALFCWGSALALAIWSASMPARPHSAWLAVAGVLAGAAAGSKYFGMVFALLALLYVPIRCRGWKPVSVFTVALLLTGAGWYIRSYVVSGDPVHPAGGNVFGTFLWDQGDLLVQKQEQASFGVSPATLNIFAALKAAGAGLWILALPSLFLRRLPSPIRCFQFIFVSYLLFWFFVTQVDRYLAPIYAVATFLSWFFVDRICRLPWVRGLFAKRLRWRIRISVVAQIIVLLAVVASVWGQLRHARSAMARWDAALSGRAGYTLFSKANEVAPQLGARMLQVGFENAIYFFHGVSIGDWFGPGRYRNMLDCSTGTCGVIEPDKMKALMSGFHARLLVIATKRFPRFDEQAYEQYFDILARDSDGVLLVLKADASGAAK